jgi:hypothetical protein
MLKVWFPEFLVTLTCCALRWGNFGTLESFEGIACVFLVRGFLAKNLGYKNDDRRKTVRIATRGSLIDKQKFTPARSDFHNEVNVGFLRHCLR